jgi:hypothetical protein
MHTYLEVVVSAMTSSVLDTREKRRREESKKEKKGEQPAAL